MIELQAEAINAAMSRKNVIVATSTASGKSLCYNIPVLEEMYTNQESCALYLFPTKASNTASIQGDALHVVRLLL